MAHSAAAARDINQVILTRDNLTVVAAEEMPTTVASRADLPTPPNSISPALAAHGLKAQLHKARLADPDSDLDLLETQSTSSRKRSISPGSEAAGAITSALLAKHHLPEILLMNGPLAIRHIIGYLTTSVPGLSALPPAKARRVVVGALEGKGGEGGGVHGEVEFRKVGWGRWEARQRSGLMRRRAISPADSKLAIPISARGPWRRDVANRAVGKGSSEADSFRFSHNDEDSALDMMANPADNMSMDEYESASCSEAPEDVDPDMMMMDDDPDEQTDDEDWAAIGAAGLRAESYNATRSGSTGFFLGSSGMARAPQFAGIDRLSPTCRPDLQEREAADALMRLASV